MEVGGTLQDSVMSYQLMHMYTALQCRHSGGFTLHKKTGGQSCTHGLNEGKFYCTITVLFLQPKQCESTRMSQVT